MTLICSVVMHLCYFIHPLKKEQRKIFMLWNVFIFRPRVPKKNSNRLQLYTGTSEESWKKAMIEELIGNMISCVPPL